MIVFVLLLLLAGCAAPAVAVREPAPEVKVPTGIAVVGNPATPTPSVVPAVAIAKEPGPVAAPAPAQADEEEDDDVSDGDDGEGESHEVAAPQTCTGPRYTAELSDAELEAKWKRDPASLGSMSVGFVDAGRLINGERFPSGPDWIVVSPEKTWGTRETIAYVEAAIRAVRAKHPDAPPLRVNQIGVKDGGWLRPHKSHQSGRDVDLGFYYPTVEPIRTRAREKVIDVGLNWALLKAIITQTDVQLILVDRHVQKVLFDYALAHGENREWLDSLFHAGAHSLIKHARGHRDHFHVRFYNPRAQELGRRIAPLLAQQPEYNLAMYKVRRGDNLGKIAMRFDSSVAKIRRANHMKSTFLRTGIVLAVPLHKPCTHCPVPPAVVIPPRRLPPEPVVAQVVSKPAVVVAAAAHAPADVAVENPVVPAPAARTH